MGKATKNLETRGKATIWTMKREPIASYKHPTQKPVELITYALTNSSKAEDIVLDLFLGSGSTLIAAEKTGRICYSCELDSKYVDVTLQRWSDYTGEDPILKETADPNDKRKGLAWSAINNLSPKENMKVGRKNTAGKNVGAKEEKTTV